ncbi:MAG: hypothetical protein WA070_00705 [Sphingobium sp.]
MIEEVLAVSGMPDKLVHVHVGLAIYVIAQLILPTRRASFQALGVLLAAELFNEVMDRLYSGSWNWPDTWTDFIATMFWPVVLVLVGRHRRKRWNRVMQDRAGIESLLALPSNHHDIEAEGRSARPAGRALA